MPARALSEKGNKRTNETRETRCVVPRRPFLLAFSLSSSSFLLSLLQPHTCHERGAWMVLPPLPASGAAAEDGDAAFLLLPALAAPSARSASSKEGGKPVATMVT